jgi:hypothetical protein
MTVRKLLAGAVLCGAVILVLGATANGQSVDIATCNQAQWCTVTASGDVEEGASQLAIGNVSAGTPLAVTQINIGQKQVGGQFLSGSLAGSCGWSQYQRDWTQRTPRNLDPPGCADPVLTTSSYVARGGRAIWSGCYPRCFGGVPVHYERRCASKGHNWCYSSNCEEFANFYPWSHDAHPADPIRMTHRHVLDVRYLARYGDAWTKTPFYLVRDISAAHGKGNWIFVSGAACGIRVGHPGAYHWLPRPSHPSHHHKPKHRQPSAHAAASA